MTVGRTILAQLGGSRFLVMTGATAIDTNDGLSFRVPSSPKKCAAVAITLDADDTYTVKAFERRPMPKCVEMVREANGVYCDHLAEIVEEMTGLALSLGSGR